MAYVIMQLHNLRFCSDQLCLRRLLWCFNSSGTMLKHADVMPSLVVPGTSKNNVATHDGGSDTTGQGHQASQGAGRRRRKANFSSEEVDILVREVSARRMILFGSAVNGRSDIGSAAAKATEKLAAWRSVATSVNSANRGEPRTVREIRKKWENVTSTFRKRQMGDLGTSIELEPHMLAGGRCPMDEVLACARAYQANRIMQQQRRNAAAASSPFMESFQADESHVKEEYTSSDDDLILDIQPDVHIESLETPLTFTDSDDVNSRNDTNSARQNVRLNIDSVPGAQDSSEGEASSSRYHGNRQLLQLQQQLRSGEVIISPAVQQGESMGNGGGGGKRDRELRVHSQPGTSASAINNAVVRKQSIEEQKLAVMKQLLKVETKRLKIEKKRLKIEKIRLNMLQNE